MKKLIIFALAMLLCLGMFTASHAAGPDDITYMTEQYPPFNYEEGGQLKGISVDILDAMLKKMGASKSKSDFELLPWAQGYKRVQTDPNTSLFAMTLTDKRKPLFKWVGPVIATRTAVFTKKGSGVTIGSDADLQNYKYGVVREDIGQHMLEAKGVGKDKMDITSKNEANIKKLNAGRIDAWAYEESSAKYQLKQAGFDPADYEVAYILQEGTLNFAFHKDTPNELLAQYQAALDALKADGTVQKIMDNYLK